MSPKYRVGEKTFRRKNFYVPCVIGNRWESLTEEEKVQVWKKTCWADNITGTEWKLLLDPTDLKHRSVVRSRFKKKMVGWFMALGRIATFDRELYNESTIEAEKLYKELIEEPHPLFPKEKAKE